MGKLRLRPNPAERFDPASISPPDTGSVGLPDTTDDYQPSYTPPTAPSTKTGDKWKDAGISDKYEAELTEWRDQFEAESGYAVSVSDDWLIRMGAAGVNTFKDFSLYLWDQGALTNDQRASEPWLGLGLATDPQSAQAQWDNLVKQYSQAWYDMTGSYLNPVFNADPNNPSFGHDDFARIYQAAKNGWSAQQMINEYKNQKQMADKAPWLAHGMTYDQYKQYRLDNTRQMTEAFTKLTGTAEGSTSFITDSLGKFQSLSEFEDAVKNDAKLQETYGWLKYGLDYQQFKQQKLQMRQTFGSDLTDAQAVLQLQYLHSSGGGGQAKGSSQAKGTAGFTDTEVR